MTSSSFTKPNMTFADVYEYLQKEYSYPSIKPFLQENWAGKEKQETLFRLFAYLGIIQDFKGFQVCSSSFNDNNLELSSRISTLLQKKVNDSGDASDLTLVNKETNTIIASSSKNKNKNGINQYGVSDLRMYYEDNHKSTYSNLIIVIVTRDKNDIQQRLTKSHKSSDKVRTILNNEHDNIRCVIYDQNDLDLWFQVFCEKFKNVDLKDLDAVVLNISKPYLKHLFPQDICVDKFKKAKYYHNTFLIGLLQRLGKSYVAARIIDDYESVRKDEATNYLWIALKYNETKEQIEKMFRETKEFHDFNFVALTAEHIAEPPKLGKKNIYLASKAFLDKKVKKGKIIEWLSKMKFDMLLIDEVDDGGCTKLAQKVYDIYASNVAYKIYITATYTKPLNTFNIHPDAMLLWDIEDVHLCKNLTQANITRLCEKYKKDTDIIMKYIDIYGRTKIQEYFNKIPNINLLTLKMNEDVENDILQMSATFKEKGYGFSSYGACLTKGDNFIDEKSALNIIEAIFGKTIYSESKRLSIQDNKNSIISRMKEIQRANGVRTFDDKLISFLCFMPTTNACDAFVKLIKKKNLAPDYDFISVHSKKNEKPLDIINKKIKILGEERQKNPKTAKKGLVIFAVRQCSAGVSLEHCIGVIHINNYHSADLLDQMNSRCNTPDENKICTFLIDLNQQRSIITMVNIAHKLYPHLPPKEGVRRIIDQKIISINSDEWLQDQNNNGIYEVKHKSFDKFMNNFYEKYQKHYGDAVGYALNELKITDKMLGDEFEYYKMLFPNFKKTIKPLLVDSHENNDVLEQQKGTSKLPDGVVRTSVNQEDEANDTDTQDANNQENINDDDIANDQEPLKRFKEMLSKLITLLSLLSRNKPHINDFKLMFESLSDENKFIIDNQLRISENNNLPSDFMEKIMNTYETHLADNEDFKNKVARVKELIVDAGDDSDKLADLVHKFIIATDKEKKDNAEYATPPQLANDMVNKVQEIDPNLFKKSFKIFDPCVGKGVFMLILKNILMKTLENTYPNPEKRLEVILTEMLYFADINPLNVYITKLLLDPTGKYHERMNYHIGDTLKLNIKDKWNIDGFELVIGNPPYNSPRNTGTGNTIWQHFVRKTLNDWVIPCGYLSFVHPPGWRKPQSENSKSRDLFVKMCHENQMLYLEIHNANDGMKAFNCGTRYDWYVVQKVSSFEHCKVKDENDIFYEINLQEWNWLPNYNFNDIAVLLARDGEKSCDVIFSRSAYGSDKIWVSKTMDDKHNNILVHSTSKSGVRYMYSSVDNKGHFGVSKVIFGDNSFCNTIIDENGEYGMTEHAIAIHSDDVEELKHIQVCLKNNKFYDNIIKPCLWSNFQIDWRLFTYFKKDFWKHL